MQVMSKPIWMMTIHDLEQDVALGQTTEIVNRQRNVRTGEIVVTVKRKDESISRSQGVSEVLYFTFNARGYATREALTVTSLETGVTRTWYRTAKTNWDFVQQTALQLVH